MVHKTSGKMGVSMYRFRPTSTLSGVTVSTDTLATTHEGAYVAILEIASGFSTQGTNGSGAIGATASASDGGGTTSLTVPITAQFNSSTVIAAIGHADTDAQAVSGSYSDLVGSEESHPSPTRNNEVYFDDTLPGGSPGASWTNGALTRGVAVEITQPKPAFKITVARDICPNNTTDAAARCGPTSDRVDAVLAEQGSNFSVTVGDHAYSDNTCTTVAVCQSGDDFYDIFIPYWGRRS